MPKDLPQDVPQAPPEPPPGVPAAVRVKALTPIQGSPEQTVWDWAEKSARTIVRTPQRLPKAPGRINEFLVPQDTSDQMVVDVTARIVMRQAADDMLLSSERIKDIYARETEAIIAKAPETFVYAGSELLDENLTHTMGESLHWLSTKYGDDYVAPWLQTFMISDNASAAKTRAMIEQIALEDVAPFDMGAGGGITDMAYATDALHRIVEGTLQFDDLSPSEQRGVQSLAMQIRLEGEPLVATGTDRVSKALWIYSSGDYGIALDDAELAQIDEVIRLGTELAPGRTNDLNDQQKALDKLGIDQIQAIDNGVLVLDEDWATQHPDDLAAIGAYLEQRYPDVRIEVGRQGVVGHVFDLIGAPADAVGTYVGSMFRGLSELQESYGGDDSKELLTRAAYLRKKMELGAVPEDEVDDTLYEIGRLEEDASHDVGLSALQGFYEQGARNANIGVGFGELTTQALGMMPGDTGYSAAVAAWTIFGQIAFDPTSYIIPAVRGIGAARKFPLIEFAEGTVPTAEKIEASIKASPDIIAGLGIAGMNQAQIDARIARVARVQAKYFARLAEDGISDAVHGIFARRIYGAIAKTPDEWLGTRPYKNFVEGLDNTRVAIDDPADYAAVLARRGIDPRRARILAGAQNIDDTDLAFGSMMLPSPNSPALAKINAKIDEVTAELRRGHEVLATPDTASGVAHVMSDGTIVTDIRQAKAAFRNVMSDLDMRKGWLESLKKPADVTGLGMGLPPKRVLNRIVNLGEETAKYDKPQYAMDVATAALGDQKFGWRERLFFAFDHLYKQSGGSREVYLTGPRQQEGIEYLQQFAEHMRIPDGRITELFAPWIAGDMDEQQLFRWFDDTFKAIIHETPTMGAAGKMEMSEWYKSFEGPRVADYVNDPNPWNTPNPVLPLGKPGAPSGRPANSASELRGMSYRIPSNRTLRSYQTMLGRTLNRMDHAKGGRYAKRVAEAAEAGDEASLATRAAADVARRVPRRTSAIAHGIGSMWYAFNDIWRTFMLATRPIGLATRVTLEQQIRIAAFGFSGFFNHPIEFLESMAPVSRMHANEFSMWTEHGDFPLGAFIDDYTKVHGDKLQHGVEVVPGNPRYVDSVVAKLHEWQASPEFNRYFIKGLADPDDWNTWDVDLAMRAFDEPLNKMVADHWRDVYENQTRVTDVRDGLQRSWDSIIQHMGHGKAGEDDVMTWLRTAMIRGKAGFEGKKYTLGSKQFIEKLKELETEKRWFPVAGRVPMDANLYAPAERAGTVRNVANAGLRKMFTEPDIMLSRHPMFAQIARREYNTLVGYGYDAERAYKISTERAAVQVADHLFELGVHTPAEVFWKNLNPFFPAWRELFTTWLLRVPMKLGGAENRGLAWAIGATALSRRIDAAVTGLEAGGFMEENSDGQLVFKVGGKEIPVQSIAGIFPLPLSLMDPTKPWPQRAQGIMPTLGAGSTMTLGGIEWAAAELFGEDSEVSQILQFVENWVAPYGTDTSLGPTAVDAFMEAFGIGHLAFWQFGQTREAHKALQISAQIDGQRLWKTTHAKPLPPPEISTPEELEAWNRKVLAPYLAEQVSAGQAYARSIYLHKGLMGSFMPFRIDSTDEGKAITEEMWQDMAIVRDLDIQGVSGLVIQDFLDEHPELESYMTGKFLDERSDVSSHETIDTFYEAVQSGDIKIRSAADWAVFNYGRTTINFMQRRISQEEQNLRDVGRAGFADYLLDPNAEDKLDELQLSLKRFRAWTHTDESLVDGQTETFGSMLTRYEHYRDERYGKQPSLLDTKEEELLQLSGLLSEFDRIVALDPEKSDKYQAVLDGIYTKLGENPGADWFDKAKSWFFEKVNGPYYDKYIPILELMDGQGEDVAVRQRGPLYDELRALAREFQDNRTHDGIIFPTPEEYQWSRWDPKQQRSKVAHWAALNPMFLTEFQRTQVGYSIPADQQDKVNKLQDFSSKVESAFSKYVGEHGYSDESRALADQYIYDRAKELKLPAAYIDEIKQPKYDRIGAALDASERTATWASMAHFADQANAYIDDAPSGEKDERRSRMFNQFVHDVDKAARSDPALNALLDEIEEGVGPSIESSERSDVLFYVFFDYFPQGSDDFAVSRRT